jgi:hypothetical protein
MGVDVGEGGMGVGMGRGSARRLQASRKSTKKLLTQS